MIPHTSRFLGIITLIVKSDVQFSLNYLVYCGCVASFWSRMPVMLVVSTQIDVVGGILCILLS